MTRVSGYRQIACPNCLSVYITPSYSSINMMAFERWSDGRTVGGLYNNGGGIRSCQCGKYYRMKDAIDMGLMMETRMIEVWDDDGSETAFDLPAFLRRQEDNQLTLIELLFKSSFITKIKERFQPSTQKTEVTISKPVDRKKRLVPKEVPKDFKDCEHIPLVQWTSDYEMENIINFPEKYDQEIIMAARRRYWPFLNDYYREPFKTYCKHRWLPVPRFKLSNEQKENLIALLEFYQAKDDLDWVTIGELLRELSRFEEAMAAFEKAMQRSHSAADLEKLTRATRNKIAGPIPI